MLYFIVIGPFDRFCGSWTTRFISEHFHKPPELSRLARMQRYGPLFEKAGLWAPRIPEGRGSYIYTHSSGLRQYNVLRSVRLSLWQRTWLGKFPKPSINMAAPSSRVPAPSNAQKYCSQTPTIPNKFILSFKPCVSCSLPFSCELPT